MEKICNIFTSNYPKILGRRTIPISVDERAKLNRDGAQLRKVDETSNATIYRDKENKQYAVFNKEE